MNLPVNPPILPMLAKRVDELPAGGTWIFEPKWDGFRTLVFRDGEEILIQSRDEKTLNRYFPELLEPLRKELPERCVLDGEIVIARDSGLDFDSLQLRIHPAASRVKLLSQEIPASIVFFDLLCEGSRDLRGEPFQSRRQELESLLSRRRRRSTDTGNAGAECRDGLVSAVRGRRPRRSDGEAGFRGLRVRQARDAQGQARARLRLRGGGLSMA